MPIEGNVCTICETAYDTPDLAAACQAKPVFPEIPSGVSFNTGPSLRKIYVQDGVILPAGELEYHPGRIHEFAVQYFGDPRHIYEIKHTPTDTIEFIELLRGSENKDKCLAELSSTQLEFFREDLYALAKEYKACREAEMKVIRLSLRFRAYRHIDRFYESGRMPELFALCKDIPADFFWRIANNSYGDIAELKATADIDRD